MRCSLLLGMLVTGCDVEEPENVRGTGVGEPSEPDPLDDTSSNTYSCADGPAFPDFCAGAIDPGLVTDQPYDFDAGVGEALAEGTSAQKRKIDASRGKAAKRRKEKDDFKF